MPEITLILHNIRSTHNVGSLFRSAEGFGVVRIVLTGYTPYPKIDNDTRLPHISEKLTEQIHKTALGAETMVTFSHYETLEEWIEINKVQNKLPLIGLEQATNSIPIQKFTPPKRFALLLGEEVHGIEADYLPHCDYIVEIPMHGQKESFNVSVAAGIALYALTSARSI